MDINKNVSFKITVEYICPDMIDENYLRESFNNNAIEAYKFISDNFSDSVTSFSSKTEKIIKVELL